MTDFIAIHNQLTRIDRRLTQQQETLMALVDTLTQLQAEDTELAADVQALGAKLDAEAAQITDLQNQIATLQASGGATPEQLAALQTVADDLAATHASAQAHLPAPVTFNAADASYATFADEQAALFTFNEGKAAPDQAPSLSFDDVNAARVAAGLEAFPEDQRPA